MTAPKRWYQLSILQMLVAMAVGSLLIILNSPNHRDQTAVLPGWSNSDVIHQFEVTVGWPFEFIHGCRTFVGDSAATVSLTQTYFSSKPHYRLWAFVADLAICAVITLSATWIVSKFK